MKSFQRKKIKSLVMAESVAIRFQRRLRWMADSRVFLLSLKDKFPNLRELIVSQTYPRRVSLFSWGYENSTDMTSMAARTFTLAPTCSHRLSRYTRLLTLSPDYSQSNVSSSGNSAKILSNDGERSWDMQVNRGGVDQGEKAVNVIHVGRPCTRKERSH